MLAHIRKISKTISKSSKGWKNPRRTKKISPSPSNMPIQKKEVTIKRTRSAYSKERSTTFYTTRNLLVGDAFKTLSKPLTS